MVSCVEETVVQREVGVRGEGGGRGGGHGAQWQRRQHGVLVWVAEEGHAVTAASARVRTCGYYHAVHLSTQKQLLVKIHYDLIKNIGYKLI